MQTSKERREKAETCSTPPLIHEMRPAQLILSQIDHNIRLAPGFSRFSAREAELRLEGMLAKADMRELEPGCTLE